MTDRPLWQWSACELAAAIAAREISAAEAVEAALGRVAETNGRINAIVEDLGTSALAEAAALDRHIAAGGTAGPLAGVPVTIKINVDQKGHATSNGVVAYRDLIAPDDAPVVRNLKRAGAIVIGRTNTPEFSFRATTDNELHGRTYNPWDGTASAGGSSGGAGAAAVMGYGALHHGNDIGGSLRFPAAACGVATVKPGLGRVPAYNPSQTAERGMLAQQMSVQGVIAREVRDLRLAMPELIAPDPRDPWHIPLPFEGSRLEPPLKVAVTRETFGHPLHPAVAEAIDAAESALSEAGYELHLVAPPRLHEAALCGYRSLFGEVKALLDAPIRQHGSETINRIFDQYYSEFPPFDGAELLEAMAQRSAYAREWSMFLEDYPLVLTPFLFQPTFAHDADIPGQGGRFEDVLGCAFYSFAFNFLALPAGVVPGNYNDGLPVGIQIVGRRYREDLVLDALEAVERHVGLMAPRLWQQVR